jgi:four helix bundle protein
MRDFRTLKVWQRAHQLALEANRLTKSFPRGGRYGLTSQINRAATSISTNLAEGCGSPSDGEFAQFVRIAMRSASELEYQLLLARDLRLVRPDDCRRVGDEVMQVRRMMTALLKKLIADSRPRTAAVSVAPDR